MKAKRVAIALLLTMLRNQNLSLLLIVSLLLAGCSEPIEKRYSNAITAGRADVRVVRDFHTLFGPSVHDAILSFDGSVGPTKWSATSIIARRYRINLQIPVSISKDGRWSNGATHLDNLDTGNGFGNPFPSSLREEV